MFVWKCTSGNFCQNLWQHFLYDLCLAYTLYIKKWHFNGIPIATDSWLHYYRYHNLWKEPHWGSQAPCNNGSDQGYVPDKLRTLYQCPFHLSHIQYHEVIIPHAVVQNINFFKTPDNLNHMLNCNNCVFQTLGLTSFVFGV